MRGYRKCVWDCGFDWPIEMISADPTWVRRNCVQCSDVAVPATDMALFAMT